MRSKDPLVAGVRHGHILRVRFWSRLGRNVIALTFNGQINLGGLEADVLKLKFEVDRRQVRKFARE